MKQLVLNMVLFSSIVGSFGCSDNNDPSTWRPEKIDKWFEKVEWLQGWQVTPDKSINRQSFAENYFKNKERWDKAFTFLKDNDLAKLELKPYKLEGDNSIVLVSEYTTKNPGDAKFEAHRKYIDLQYVVTGSELIGLAPLASQDFILQEYDEGKDIEFLSIKKGIMLPAVPAKFFIFFPEDAHMPGVKTETNASVRKIVVKLRID